MSRYRSYGALDDQPVLDGDRAFLGFGSFRDAGSIPENYLSESQNLRLETNSAIVRKGLKRLTGDATVLASTVLTSTFYRDPATGTEYVVLACSDRAYFVNPADGTKKTILYAGGETAAAGCMLMQAFHYLFLWRTDSPSLPFILPTTLGKYPLIFDGDDLGGLAVTGATNVSPIKVTTAVHNFATGDKVNISGVEGNLATNGDWQIIVTSTTEFTLTGSTGSGTFSGSAGIVSESKFERPMTSQITAATNATPIVVTTAGTHGYTTGDSVKVVEVLGNTNANGTRVITVLSSTTFSLDGSTGNSTYTGGGYASSENSTIPPSSYAIYTSDRLCVLTGRDTVRFSMLGDPNKFRYQDQNTFNAGDSDVITSLSPIEGDALLVGKRRSLLVMTSISDLYGPNEMTSEISNQFGIVARETVRQVGGLIFFLNDSGVYSVNAAVRGSSRVGTPVAYLQITDDPISADIEDEIEAINFTTARTTACAVVASNRYYLAVPSSPSGNDKILIYNIVLNSWESVDTLPAGVYVDNLIRIIYEDQLRVAAICSSGKILLLEENANGTDEYGNGGSATTVAVDAKAVTRLYRGGDVSSVKRWKIATIGSTTKTADSTKFRILANTREPDSAEVELGEFTTTAVEEDFRRLGIRQRGNGIQITIDNGATAAGRWELRDISIEGHTGSRQRRSYA